MTPRKRFTAKFRKEFFAKHNGVCSICNGHIDDKREAWDIEHTNPLAMTGTNDESNLTLVHAKCHKAKTKSDVKNIAQAKRREAKNIGAVKPKGQIANRGFAKPDKPERVSKPMPPRRPMFEEI